MADDHTTSPELLPNKCVKALTKIRSLLQHSTDDAVSLVYDIGEIVDDTLTRQPQSPSPEQE